MKKKLIVYFILLVEVVLTAHYAKAENPLPKDSESSYIQEDSSSEEEGEDIPEIDDGEHEEDFDEDEDNSGDDSEPS